MLERWSRPLPQDDRVDQCFVESDCPNLCFHSLVPGVFADDSDGTAFSALGYFDPMNPFVCDLSLAVPVNLYDTRCVVSSLSM